MTVHRSDALLTLCLTSGLKPQFNGGNLLIYTGTQPAASNTAPSGTLLATLPLSAIAAFSPPSAGVMTLNGTPSASVVAAGDAGWARFAVSGDLGTTNTTDPRMDVAVASSTTLTAGVTATQTSFTVSSTGSFPTAGTAFCGAEQFSYTGKTATTLTGITRGVNGTTATVHASAAAVTIAGEITFDIVTLAVANTVTCTSFSYTEVG